ncbi:MAG: CDP-alcohol phosphatidyltransferase family protein [Candidatus Aminicenantes bacterium]|nr:CDP-alcohol phosphatidyltransferase family protein [Candidatus Aminicenantes bacterium]
MRISQIEAEFDYDKAMKNVHSYPFLHKYLPFDRYVIRPPAGLIAKALFRTSVTPNQVTVTSLFFALLAAVSYSYGRPVYFAVGGGLTLVSMILDAADGMLARAKNMTSRYGAFLDLFLDRIADFAVLAGASYGYYAYTRNQAFLALGLVTIGLYFLQLTLYYIELLYTRADKSGEGAEAKSLAVCYIFVVSIAGRPDLILVAVFLMSVTSGVIKIIRFLRRDRDPEAIPPR